MELRHLNLIKVLHEHQTLTKAGEVLFLTQSALSHQLKEVESFFAATLFSRIGKKMIITQAGLRVLEVAERVITELENCKHDMQNLSDGKSGKIKLTTACYTSYHWLSFFLKKYNMQYPGIELDIIPEATRCPVEYLEAGKLDIAILDYQPENSSLKVTKIFEDELLLITSPDHRLAGKKIIQPTDLVDEIYIMYSLKETESQTYNRLFTENNITPKRVKKMQLTEGIIELVKANLGVSVLAKWALEPYLKRGELVGIRIGRTGYKRNWYVATLKDKMQPKFVEDFSEHIRQFFPSKLEAVPQELKKTASYQFNKN
jgi:LysR family transcriptional regulator, regulator for metE and metH